MADKFWYTAKVLGVVDGDTVDLLVDVGFDIHFQIRVRLHGVNTPESRTTNKLEKAAGLKAKEFVKHWVEENPVVFINTIADKKEKFGRILAKIYSDEKLSSCLNEELITRGFAKAYFGEKKEEFTS